MRAIIDGDRVVGAVTGIVGDGLAIPEDLQGVPLPELRVVDGKIVRVEPEPPALADVRARARATIATSAEAARLQFITGGSGKALAYEAKREEARRWQDAVDGGGTPDIDDFPWLKARAELLGVPGQAVADEWNARAAAWAAAGVQIETAYDAAVAAIDAAQDRAEIDAALAAATFPEPA